jgi:hypothetical protein
MLKYLLVNTNTLLSRLVSLDEAARITELCPDEIEWAIEQVGRCNTEEWAILPEGATYAVRSEQSRSQSERQKLAEWALKDALRLAPVTNSAV